jgi:soluble lytic murein transglycosylase
LRSFFPDYAHQPFSALPEDIWQLLYPIRHWSVISAHAAKTRTEPSLILGLIRQESAFNLKARSAANARGLMQILPSTGARIARQAKIRPYGVQKLYQAETNINIGVRCLASLLRRYGKAELALAAYNAGESRVDRWLEEFGNVDMPEFVELVPFSETRGYIKQVLCNQAIYSQLISSTAVAAR